MATADLSPSYYVSPSDPALSKCARFYVYGKAHLPKQFFDDAEFRDICQGFYDPGGGSGKAPFLTAKGLKAYVVAEYGTFKAFARFMVKSVVKYAEGNPPCQSMHDCATLKSHTKIMAVGCELVDPDLDACWSVACR